VKKCPDELAGNIFETELEGCVLLDRVMSCVKGERPNRVALLVGDLVRADHARRIAGTSGGDRSIERYSRRVAKSNSGRRGLEHACEQIILAIRD
jgi:hypothetical protein